ncbi:MAG: hypothetical protein KDD73_13635 [Anaerolineales bacterium]|nr:hypothetical protein [Anaerolineales bacterium]MCB9127552.1 hypothetical protein [Ardenticatenales bacterium]
MNDRSTEHEIGFVLFLLARASQRQCVELRGASAGLASELRRRLGAAVAVLADEQTAPNGEAAPDMIVAWGDAPRLAFTPQQAAATLWVGRGAISAEAEANAVDAWPALRFIPIAQPSLSIVGAGSRTPRFAESPSEALIAALLHAAQPTTVVLGPDVVFDGAAKPPASKISFSGTGGQIGKGDWLIVHPDSLDRFSPLPGAVALVLGSLAQPVNAPHVTLTLGGTERALMTLIVAE